MKTLLRFLLFFFVILPMQAQVTPPHDTGFESADGFTFGNLSGQNNWSMDQGTANVIDTDDRSGTYSVKVEASSPFTRISRGPAGFVDGPNLYAYVRNNSINLIDPTGEIAFVLVGIGVGMAVDWAYDEFAADHVNDYIDDNFDCNTQKHLRTAGEVINLARTIKNPAKLAKLGAAKKTKPSSPGEMQKEVERGQAPKDVDRVDRGHVEGQDPHVYYKDGTSSTQTGGVHDAHKGQPNPPKKTKRWLEKHNWNPPKEGN